MENINILKQSFEQQKISLSRYGIDLLCRLILALIQTRCVNLKKVAAALYGPAKVDSHYRRLQRFPAQQISPDIFATLILATIAQEGQHLYLSLDRTHWKLGKTHQYILLTRKTNRAGYGRRAGRPGRGSSRERGCPDGGCWGSQNLRKDRRQ